MMDAVALTLLFLLIAHVLFGAVIHAVAYMGMILESDSKLAVAFRTFLVTRWAFPFVALGANITALLAASVPETFWSWAGIALSLACCAWMTVDNFRIRGVPVKTETKA